MKRALLFVILAFVLLYVVRKLEYMGLRKNKHGEFAKLQEAFEDSNNFDLLILGSSRAESQYYTPYLDSVSGLHSFNIGMTGATMPFMRTAFEAYLVHSKAPEYVLLNIDLHSFSDNPDTIYNFPRYFAYLDNEKLYEGLAERDKRFRYFKWLPFYSMPFYSSHYFNSSLRGWIGKEGKYDRDYIQGFAPEARDTLFGDIDTMKIAFFTHRAPAFVWTELERIRQICLANGSRLILCVSPLFYRWEAHVLHYQEDLSRFREYAQKSQLAFIDLSHDSIRFHKEYYADPAHMNKAGAFVFTRHLYPELAQYLKP